MMSANKLFIYGLLGLFVLTGATRSCEKSDKGEDRIQWSEDRPLTWKDFKGKPDKQDTVYDARTFVQIVVRDSVFDNYISCIIPCTFNRSYSWSSFKSKKQESLWLLEHEQLHFDIAELMARKIRKEYSEYRSYNLSTTYSDLQVIYNKYFPDELTELNVVYDSETQHGKLRDKQNEWESKIKKELYKLRKYADTEVKVRRITVMEN